ncbi:hypothetical protein [Natronorubrum sp. DTA7]|uniref:hypothetical protein n=1 Tax=Natronorubrum sp. DTA7 TaxID=3447016 RepID=UPI003F8673BE
MSDSEPRSSGTERTADEWEQYLEEHPDEVLMYIDEDYSIHTFEHEPEKDELCFLVGGTRGYDYDGSRTALESFADDDSDIHKLVPRDKEHAERKALCDGEFETPSEWAECSLHAESEQGESDAE